MGDCTLLDSDPNAQSAAPAQKETRLPTPLKARRVNRRASTIADLIQGAVSEFGESVERANEGTLLFAVQHVADGSGSFDGLAAKVGVLGGGSATHDITERTRATLGFLGSLIHTHVFEPEQQRREPPVVTDATVELFEKANTNSDLMPDFLRSLITGCGR